MKLPHEDSELEKHRKVHAILKDYGVIDMRKALEEPIITKNPNTQIKRFNDEPRGFITIVDDTEKDKK